VPPREDKANSNAERLLTSMQAAGKSEKTHALINPESKAIRANT
jgi:hypothetical protein